MREFAAALAKGGAHNDVIFEVKGEQGDVSAPQGDTAASLLAELDALRELHGGDATEMLATADSCLHSIRTTLGIHTTHETIAENHETTHHDTTLTPETLRSYELHARTVGSEDTALYLLRALGEPNEEAVRGAAGVLHGEVLERIETMLKNVALCDINLIGEGDEPGEVFGRKVDIPALLALWRVGSVLCAEYEQSDIGRFFVNVFFRNFRHNFESASSKQAASQVEITLNYLKRIMHNHWAFFLLLLPSTHPEHRFETTFFGAVLDNAAVRIAAGVDEKGVNFFLAHFERLLKFEETLSEIPVIGGGAFLAKIVTDRVAEGWVEAEKRYFNSVLNGCLKDTVVWAHHTPTALLRYDPHKASRGVVQLCMAVDVLCQNLQRSGISSHHIDSFITSVARPALLQVPSTIGSSEIPNTQIPTQHSDHPLLPRIIAVNSLEFIRFKVNEWELLPMFAECEGFMDVSLDSALTAAEVRLKDKIVSFCLGPIKKAGGEEGGGGTQRVAASFAGRMEAVFGYLRLHCTSQRFIESVQSDALKKLQAIAEAQLREDGGTTSVESRTVDAANYALSSVVGSISGARKAALMSFGA